jgi:flagellar biosynthesis protein FliR
MSQPQQTYTGQTFTAPVYVNGNLEIDPQITIARMPYLLERYDFDKIIRGESFWLTIGRTLLGAALGLFLNLISKFLGSTIDSKISFDMWEVYAFCIALILMVISYLINHWVPNERRRIVRKISEHFENS